MAADPDYNPFCGAQQPQSAEAAEQAAIQMNAKIQAKKAIFDQSIDAFVDGTIDCNEITSSFLDDCKLPQLKAHLRVLKKKDRGKQLKLTLGGNLRSLRQLVVEFYGLIEM